MMKEEYVAEKKWKRCQWTECYIQGVLLSKKANCRRVDRYCKVCHLLNKKREIQMRLCIHTHTCTYIYICFFLQKEIKKMISFYAGEGNHYGTKIWVCFHLVLPCGPYKCFTYLKIKLKRMERGKS